MPSAVTAEELEFLSPEEQEALADDDESDGNVTPAVAEVEEEPVQADSEATAEGDGADPTPEPEPETEAEATPPQEVEEPVIPAVEDGDDDEPEEVPPLAAEAEQAPESLTDSFRPLLPVTPLPEDFDATLAQVVTDIDSLDAQLESGDIDYAVHRKAIRSLDATQRQMENQKIEHDRAVQTNTEATTQHWNWEVERFVDDNAVYKNDIAYGALQGALSQLIADEANAGKSYRWYLKEAHSKVGEAFPAAAAPANDPTPETPAPAPASSETKTVAKARADVNEAEKSTSAAIPKTLANVAESAASTTDKDEFSVLDDLVGDDLELALANMPKAQADKFLDSRNF